MNMRILYHFWLSPFCRKVRIALQEKGVEFELEAEKYWERRRDFLILSPSGEVPVLQEPDGLTIADSQAIVEYLEDVYDGPSLLGTDPAVRAECRRLTAWFDRKFYTEVTDYLVTEKFLKRYMRMGQPQSERIRAGAKNIGYHLDYIGYLAERQNYLASEDFSLADIAAAAQVSCLDYLGDVPWKDHPAAKDWYARVKSRPSMRPILADHIPGLPPPKHYADLDF
jgi:glutathione S-transferase